MGILGGALQEGGGQAHDTGDIQLQRLCNGLGIEQVAGLPNGINRARIINEDVALSLCLADQGLQSLGSLLCAFRAGQIHLQMLMSPLGRIQLQFAAGQSDQLMASGQCLTCQGQAQTARGTA